MSALAVSNDVLRESLRMPAPPPLSARLEQQLSAWFPTFERRLIDALYWFTDRPPWQRGALSMGVGAVIGLSVVVVGAGVFGWQRKELSASAPAPRAAALAVVSPRIAALPAPSVAPIPAPTAAAAPAPTVLAAPPPSPTAQVAQAPDAKPGAKHAKNAKKQRSRKHHHAASKNGTWTFPRPQRRSP